MTPELSTTFSLSILLGSVPICRTNKYPFPAELGLHEDVIHQIVELEYIGFQY